MVLIMHPVITETLFQTQDLESIFSLARNKIKRVNLAGRSVSIRRMECFAVKGDKCVTCGLEANTIMVDKWSTDGSVHLDLFHVGADNNRVLMTIDHIIPKSKGGPNSLDNYQPMCQPCNSLKGNII